MRTSDDARAPIVASEAPSRPRTSAYPAPFAARMQGREKKALGERFGLANFGVNLTRLQPGGISALRHWHERQDEFVYVLSGRPTLRVDGRAFPLEPGMCVGFPAGRGEGHHFVNETDEDAVYLEIGDRTAGDIVHYPDEDLVARETGGRWTFTHKDGTPY